MRFALTSMALVVALLLYYTLVHDRQFVSQIELFLQDADADSVVVVAGAKSLGVRECVPFNWTQQVNLSNPRGGSLPYGPCNWLPDQRPDHFCECVRPFSWVDVTPTDALQYLTAAEMLSAPGPLNVTQRKCTAGSCCLGKLTGSWKNKRCDGEPIKRFDIGRKLFTSAQALELLPNATRLTLLGDSVGYQIYTGLLCDLTRSGASFVGNERYEMTRNLQFWKIGWGSLMTVEVLLKSGSVVTVQAVHEYRPHENGLTIKEACYISDILVFNFGLHYNSRMHQASKLYPVVFPALKEHCIDRGVKVVFRGTTSQHFYRPGGTFSAPGFRYGGALTQSIMEFMAQQWKRSDLGYGYEVGCTAQRWMNGYDDEYDWRNRQTVAALRKSGYNVRLPPWGDDARALPCRAQSGSNMIIDYIPMGELTAELWRLHFRECTHYCASPLLWAPIWDALYLFFQSMSKNCDSSNTRDPNAAPLMDPMGHIPIVRVPVRYFIDEFQNATPAREQVYKSS